MLPGSVTSCKVLRSCKLNVSNFCNLVLAHGIYNQCYSVDRSFVIAALFMEPVLIGLYGFIAGHSCLRNNIVNLPAPPLLQYKYLIEAEAEERKKRKKEKISNKMTASALKQDPKDPNTKRFKRMLMYFDRDTQYANLWGNPLCQATKQHLNNRQTA